MKKILLVTSGGLPLPAVKGGAVETLSEILLKENEKQGRYDISVLSIWNEEANKLAKSYKNAKFIFFKINNFINSMVARLVHLLNKCLKTSFCNETLFLLNVMRHVKKNTYDIIVIENRDAFVIPIAKYNVHHAKLVLHVHNSYLGKNTKNAVKKAAVLDQIITVSDFLTNEVLEINDMLQSKVVTLKNCIDTCLFKNKKNYEFRENFRKLHGIKDEDTVFLYCGRINPTKGVYELVKAFNRLNNMRTYLLIIGASWYSCNNKNDYLEKIKKEAEKSKDRIVFTGYINHDEIPKYYSIGDVAMVPSMWDEPAGLVVTEALAAGLPLITTNKGGIPEYANKNNAIFLPVDQVFVQSLTEEMNRMTDPSIRIKTSEGATAFAEKYNAEHYYADFSKIMNQMFE